MSEDEVTHKGIAQREESNSLLKAVLSTAKGIGGALVLLAVSGIGVAWSDHYNLASLNGKVDALVLVVNQSAIDARQRGDANFQHLTQIDADLVTQRATALALDGRIRDLEKTHHPK